MNKVFLLDRTTENGKIQKMSRLTAVYPSLKAVPMILPGFDDAVTIWGQTRERKNVYGRKENDDNGSDGGRDQVATY